MEIEPRTKITAYMFVIFMFIIGIMIMLYDIEHPILFYIGIGLIILSLLLGIIIYIRL